MKYETCWYNGVEKIDGFKFYSKKPFSRSYQYHSTIGLEYTYPILELISNAIKDKSIVVQLEIISGWGKEYVYIWRDSLKKAEKLMLKMIKQIQKQY